MLNAFKACWKDSAPETYDDLNDGQTSVHHLNSSRIESNSCLKVSLHVILKGVTLCSEVVGT